MSVNRQPLSCPLVFACDEGYAMPLATTMRSVVESNASHWPIDMYVLSDGVSQPARELVEQSLPPGAANIRWVTVDLGGYDGFSTPTHISRTTYARLVIPRVLPEALDRVLYLDADLLVLDDLEKVCGLPMDGVLVGAVLDTVDGILKRGEPGWEAVPRVAGYFNAGVLLINLAAWRRERVAEQAMEYLGRNPDCVFCDQDPLNVICDRRWKALDARWNYPCFMSGAITDLPADKRPGIAHFLTRRKPWDPRYRSPNAAIFDSFRRRTRFARTPTERVRDAVVRFVAGCKNVLRRRGLLPADHEGEAPTVPRKRKAS
jgi:lipopolysaccharide biosynthesis glycosyltransferase